MNSKEKEQPLAERIYANQKINFSELINSLINHKIDELVNNANKVNTATSQINKKESDVS
ncbi:hypothetical protein CD798_09880 [Bacillaceae bacterium SAOS 7]|nr:hypothetical protein CD798_09880 [Bacillaceae bacterium SAOS 7]